MRSSPLVNVALAILGCALGIFRPAWASGSSLQNELRTLAKQARPGTLGITVSDLQTGRAWRINADRAYPMMSVFKAPLGATVLSEVALGKISLDQTVIVRREDLMTAGVSAIAKAFHGDQEAFTVRQLLSAAVSHSDNTAADVLLKLAGGAGAVTAFLQVHGITHMRVDRGEEEIARQFQQAGTPHQGYEAYMSDPRDRTTPDDAALFLRKLWRGELLPAAATHHLLDLLYAQTVPYRLRAGIPAGVRLADKCGTSYTVDGRTAAFNDIGILTWPDGHTVIVAAFLTGSNASETRMNALFKVLAGDVVEDLK